MPIYEADLTYSWFVCSRDSFLLITDEVEQGGAISEFNEYLTDARESVQSLSIGVSASESKWTLKGVLTLDTDGALANDTPQPPEQQLAVLADSLDTFLVGRFRIQPRSSARVFGEIRERPRRQDEAIIVTVTLSELFGTD